MPYSPRSESRSRVELKINSRDLLEVVFHQFITYIQPYAGLLVPYTSDLLEVLFCQERTYD